MATGLARLRQKLKKAFASDRRREKDGAILMEFAIAVPVLAALLYYVHDLPKYEHIRSKTKLCIHCAVNMLQNISQNSKDKRVTMQDIKRISCAAFLPYFGPGTKQYQGGGGTASIPYGGVVRLRYLEGRSNGIPMVLWEAVCTANTVSKPSDASYSDAAGSIPYNRKTDMYPGLSVHEGEARIILEIGFTGTLEEIGNYGSRRCWGLHALTPGYKKLEMTHIGGSREIWFHRAIIFSPKPNLFDDSTPSSSKGGGK
jgi:hypothetical protein